MVHANFCEAMPMKLLVPVGPVKQQHHVFTFWKKGSQTGSELSTAHRQDIIPKYLQAYHVMRRQSITSDIT